MRKMQHWCLILFIGLSLVNCEQESKGDFDPNFAHVVYFWFENPDNVEDRAFFEASLQRFLDSSKYAKTNFIGTAPKATRDVVDDSYTYNIILTFASAEDQEAYQTEDVHLQFIEESKHLWKKVIVYDAIPVTN